ncbi:hypothetical protein ON010_g17682 [Phytophthora cinnamomi]|nr:hypothetical protein ON010_g17682 [Phytophthora cinnamomi]
MMLYENTNSKKLKKREEQLDQTQQSSQPPCVQTPEYPWPKKLLTKPPVGSEQVHMVRLHPDPGAKLEKQLPAQTDRLSETESSGASDKEHVAASVGKDNTVEPREAVEDGRPDSEDPEIQLELIKDCEGFPDEGSSSDSDEFYDAISFDGEYLSERAPEVDGEHDPERDEYEVEKILHLRWSKRTRTSGRTREYLIKWKGYEIPEWLPVSQLSCGALLYEFNQGARARAPFQTMQTGDDHPRA